jgi:hypothetical protein
MSSGLPLKADALPTPKPEVLLWWTDSVFQPDSPPEAAH